MDNSMDAQGHMPEPEAEGPMPEPEAEGPMPEPEDGAATPEMMPEDGPDGELFLLQMTGSLLCAYMRDMVQV